MVATMRRRVKVVTDGVITIECPDLRQGDEVLVWVEPVALTGPPTSLAGLMGGGKGCYATAEEADQFIRQERDEWDY